MKINEVAKLTGITVRTLQYYDKIGLLKPSATTDVGYRIYDTNALVKLQQILLFKELDFPLNEIKAIINSQTFDKNETLKYHKEMLMKKRERLDKLITLVDDTMEGKGNMKFEEFDISSIENTKQKYAKEVKERWGNTDAYTECAKKTNNYSEKQWQSISVQGIEILKTFAANKDKTPDQKEVQSLVKEWQNYITASYYNCTKEILQGLGLMYVYDERFKENIDQYGEGTAEFMAQAIAIYCEK